MKEEACDVTDDSSPSWRSRRGASRYVDVETANVAAELARLGGARVIVATAPSSKAISALVDGLAIGGKLVIVGASPEPIDVTPIQLILARRSIQGWPSGTSRDSEDALTFCARSGVRPMVERFPLARAAEAYERMMTNRVRFRGGAHDGTVTRRTVAVSRPRRLLAGGGGENMRA